METHFNPFLKSNDKVLHQSMKILTNYNWIIFDCVNISHFVTFTTRYVFFVIVFKFLYRFYVKYYIRYTIIR